MWFTYTNIFFDLSETINKNIKGESGDIGDDRVVFISQVIMKKKGYILEE